jgi:hypothetical protein
MTNAKKEPYSYTMEGGVPFFVLSAADSYTVPLLRRWIRKARVSGVEASLIESAAQTLKRIITWRAMNIKKPKPKPKKK